MPNVKFICIFCCSMLFILTACNEAGNTAVSTLKMNEATEVSFNRFVESAECILLEEPKQGYIAEGWSICGYKDYLYLLNWGLSSRIDVYTTDGHFVRTLGSQSGEVLELVTSIWINEQEEQLWVMNGNQLNKFTLNGTYLKQEKQLNRAAEITRLSKDRLLVYGIGNNKRLSHFFYEADNQLNDLKKFHVTKEIKKGEGRSFGEVMAPLNASESIYMLLELNDTLYRSAQGGAVLPYRIVDFEGDRQLRKEYKTLSFKEEAALLKSKRYLGLSGGIQGAREKLFLKSTGKRVCNYIIDLQRDSVYKTTTLIDGLTPTRAIFENILGSNDEALFTLLDVKSMRTHYETYTGEIQFPAIKAAIQNGKDEQLVVLKMKIK